MLGRRLVLSLGVAAAALALVSACAGPFGGETSADRLTPPQLGTCRDLTPEHLTAPSNATDPVPCSTDHTAQTFAIGTLPTETGSAYDDKRHGEHVYAACQKAFGEFLGADESVALRSRLSWAWFRPSEKGWTNGARWYRCDVIGGPAGATRLKDLPSDARGMFSTELPDAWMTCARGGTVATGVKVDCTEKHDWRAVTTVKIGQPTDPYPGDRIVEVRSRDFCKDSVGGWMHYPPDYDYGYTWFREAQWSIGNRRSICWARVPD